MAGTDETSGKKPEDQLESCYPPRNARESDTSMIKAKYLRLICETIRNLKLDEPSRSEVAHAFATALVDTNAGFDTDRFFRECEIVR